MHIRHALEYPFTTHKGTVSQKTEHCDIDVLVGDRTKGNVW